MADYTIEKISKAVIMESDDSFKIVEPKTIKDMDGKEVSVPGNTYTVRLSDIDKRIVAAQVTLDKFLKIKADIEKL